MRANRDRDFHEEWLPMPWVWSHAFAAGCDRWKVSCELTARRVGGAPPGGCGRWLWGHKRQRMCSNWGRSTHERGVDAGCSGGSPRLACSFAALVALPKVPWAGCGERVLPVPDLKPPVLFAVSEAGGDRYHKPERVCPIVRIVDSGWVPEECPWPGQRCE